MKVTAIIAAHNYGKWVGEAIQSALTQKNCDLQIAVYNDGSTDNTHEECCKHLNITPELIEAGKNKPLQIRDLQIYAAESVNMQPTYYMWCDKPSGGPSFPRNCLINWLWDKTDVFAPLDADDSWLPHRIEKLINVLKDENILAAWSDYYTEDTNTGILQTVVGRPYSFLGLRQENIVHSGCMFKKSAAELVREGNQIYCEDLRVAEDMDLWFRLSEKGLLYHYPEPLLIARIHSNNSTNSVKQETWQHCWQLVQERTIKRGTPHN